MSMPVPPVAHQPWPSPCDPVAPSLAWIGIEAEDLVVAGRDGREPSVSKTPNALIPGPNRIVGAAEKEDIIGGVCVADVADIDLHPVSGGGGPAAPNPEAPHLA